MTHVIADDAERILPRAELDELSASGLLGITVPRSHGGAEVSARTLGEVVRLRSAADAGIGQIPQHHFFFVMRVFERFRKRRAIDLMRVATAVCS
ncbi:acyl-CoA dehydrogenase family protein [Streptomyces sp. V4I2]|uniref:acyl-CoA dehydrogenase family protein n=1 Tax=Streptomyces sp. V4I2 TaxID=3042280 RepID=UPI003593ADD6